MVGSDLVGNIVVLRKPDTMDAGVLSTAETLAAQNLTGDNSLHCSRGALLGHLGLFVQLLLAVIAFTSLIGQYLRVLNVNH